MKGPSPATLAREAVARRQHALKNPFGSGLVIVRCEKCQRPIATTDVDRAKGEPPILLDFPEYATGWECFECAACPTCNAIVGCRCEESAAHV